MTRFGPPTAPFRATVAVPGDKSISHRALLLAGIASGDSLVHNRNPGADVVATERAVAALGVAVDGAEMSSPGRRGWSEPGSIDCGNSGTSIRLLAGALAASSVSATLDGDESLRSRPMERVAEPLRSLGADIETSAGRPPITVRGGRMAGGHVELEVASAQVRTAVALASLDAAGPVTIDSPPGFRDHTERWLETAGRGEYVSETAFRVDPGPLAPVSIAVPGDASAAAFVWTAAALVEGAEITTPDVTLNPGRIRLIEILKGMGAAVHVQHDRQVMGDPTGTVTVVGADLRATEVDGVGSAQAIDELPLVALAASVASGTSRISGAGELAIKESDRLAVTASILRVLGAQIEVTDDGWVIDGVERLVGGSVDARGDHRMAMMAAVASAASQGDVEVIGAEAAGISWPGFEEVLRSIW